MSIQEKDKKNIGDKALSTAYKVGGLGLKFRAISSLIIGIILIVLGVILAIIYSSFNALVLSLIGILALIASWINWKRSKSLTKGRFY
ncbi:MAG: hypothetical protein ABIH72_00540 [archaeon]